jgi:hypothetical protein
MTDISLVLWLYKKNVCGDGKEMKGLPRRNVAYIFVLPVSFAICVILVHLEIQTPSASLPNPHTIPHLCPQLFVISLSTSPCPSISKLIFSTVSSVPSNYYFNNPRYKLAVCATVLNVRWSLNFVAFGFFWKKFILTQGHCPVSCMLLICPINTLRPLTPLHFTKYNCIYLLYLLRVLIRLPVFWSIRSTAAVCNIILPNIHYLLSSTILMPLYNLQCRCF